MRRRTSNRSNDQKPQTTSTLCVITTHNYARYLPACLESVLSQSMPFSEVILVNDSSNDSPELIAEKYGVTIVRAEFRDVALSRNLGYQTGKPANFVLFVDADNVLPLDYHERLLEPFSGKETSPQLGITYGNLRRFHDGSSPEEGSLADYVHPYDYRKLRRENYFDTCSLIRREAFEQSGMWWSGDYTGLHDWHLWLRITRLGWKALHIPEAELGYRVHPGGMLQTTENRRVEGAVNVMRDAMRICILTLFSGREWALRRYFFDLRNATAGWNQENLVLLALDNSDNARFSLALREQLIDSGFQFQYIRDTSRIMGEVLASDFAHSAKLRTDASYSMNAHLAKLYAKAGRSISQDADLIFSWEDDISPPAGCLYSLSRALYTHPEAGVVSGMVRNRFGSLRVLAWEPTRATSLEGDSWDIGWLENLPKPGEVCRVSTTGFGCTLFRRDTWDSLAFRPSRNWRTDEKWSAYDHAAGLDVMQRGEDWLLSGDVKCLHWQPDGSYLEV